MRRLFQGENEIQTQEANEIDSAVSSFMDTILKKHEGASIHDIELVVGNMVGLACAEARLRRAMDVRKAKKEGQDVFLI